MKWWLLVLIMQSPPDNNQQLMVLMQFFVVLFSGPQYLLEMWNYICPELMKAIETEPETDVVTELMLSLAKV